MPQLTLRVVNAILLTTIPKPRIPSWKAWVLEIMRIPFPIGYLQEFYFVLDNSAEYYGVMRGDVITLENGTQWIVTDKYITRVRVQSVTTLNSEETEASLRGAIGTISASLYIEGHT